MKVLLGKSGLTKSWQGIYPATARCAHCGATARIAFVAYEGDEDDPQPPICRMHPNDPEGTGLWPHDVCAVAVYLCTDCLEATAVFNQA